MLQTVCTQTPHPAGVRTCIIPDRGVEFKRFRRGGRAVDA